MFRTIRLAVGGLAAVGLLAACQGDVLSPETPVGPRFSGSGSGGSAGGGGGKTTCTNTLGVSATASEALSGNTFSATYVLNACQSKTRVSMTVTDLTTGAVVWYSLPDIVGTVALWTLPYRLTSYRIDARAVAGSANTVVATASTVVSTLDALPCTMAVNQTVTVGYYITWPAVWAATEAQDCGQGGTVHLRITNMISGRDELDLPVLGTSSFIDFEGAIVSYSTPYRVYAELRSSAGEVLASSSRDIVSSPLR